MHLLADVAPAAASAPGLSINFFWVIVAALNFVFFLALIWMFAFKPIANILGQRKSRIEQGLTDAAQARKERDAGAAERERLISEARRESQALIATAQKTAQDLRDSDIAATREELGRLHEKAAADIAAERDRALADLRAQVADLALAAAGVVVGETMTKTRQRRLVEEFLAERSVDDGRRN
ncbi:MAG TPA: F0F1 ATP synthase subunit B [Terriglobales bacterium]|nr:F0F1 ATP synthase subunit B [Terriglobales bacterium]